MDYVMDLVATCDGYMIPSHVSRYHGTRIYAFMPTIGISLWLEIK